VQAHAEEVAAMVAIAPFPLPVITSISQPLLIIAAKHDRFMPLAKLQELTQQAEGPSTSLVCMDDQDHMFGSAAEAITKEIVEWSGWPELFRSASAL
jgi:hypothetical protein